jgi:hypothetical protein
VPGGSGATGSGAEGSAGLVISRRAVLLGAGAASVHAVLFVGGDWLPGVLRSAG